MAVSRGVGDSLAVIFLLCAYIRWFGAHTGILSQKMSYQDSIESGIL